MLEKYYQLSASSGFAGEDEERIMKIIGEKRDIDRYIENYIDEMHDDAIESAVINLQYDYDYDYEDVYEHAQNYVSESYIELTKEEFEKEIDGTEADYKVTMSNLTIYIWYR